MSAFNYGNIGRIKEVLRLDFILDMCSEIPIFAHYKFICVYIL